MFDRPSASRKRRLPSRRVARCALEALEGRRLLTTMTVTGTAGADTIGLTVSGGGVAAVVNGTPTVQPDLTVTDVTINGVGGNDTIVIHSNGANPVTINAGIGDDTIQLTPNTQDLDNLGSAIVVNGEAGNDGVTLFDANNGTSVAFVFSGDTELERGGGKQFTFNATVEAVTVDSGSGNDTFSFNGDTAFAATVDGNGGSDRVQVDGGGTQNIVYNPSATTPGSGSIDLGVKFATFLDCNDVFTTELIGIQMITPNPNDVINVNQLNGTTNRVTGTSGGVAITPLFFGAITGEVHLNLGSNDLAGPTTNTLTLAQGLVGASAIAASSGPLTGNSTSNLAVTSGTWTVETNPGLNRTPWNVAVSGTGTDVTFVSASELFRRLELNGGATVHFSGINNDAQELAVTAGTGTVDVAAAGRFEVFGNFGIGAGNRLRKTGAGVLLTTSSVDQAHGAGSVLEVDAGTFEMRSDAGTATSRALSIDSNATVNLGSTQHLAGVFADVAGTVRVLPDGNRVLVVTDVAVNGEGGQIDLTDNDMILDYTGATQVDAVRLLLRGGFAGGAWNGIGISSSTAAANPLRSLGYAEATDLFTAFPATFSGEQVDSTSVLLKHTFSGDHDLNGNVNLSDFNRLAANFGQSGKRWVQGDNDYNGIVNLADFNRLAASFGGTGLASPDGRAGGAGRRGGELTEDAEDLLG